MKSDKNITISFYRNTKIGDMMHVEYPYFFDESAKESEKFLKNMQDLRLYLKSLYKV